MRYRFIDAEKAHYPIRLMCRVLEVASSGYYAWRGRGPSRRAQANERLLVEIRACHGKSRGTYGSPRIHRTLSSSQRRVSKHRIARLMQVCGIRSKHRRKYRVTTQSNHRRPIAENVLSRQFVATQPNRVWVGDITFILTGEGWFYLAVLIDLFSRTVVGWSMGDRVNDELTLAALRMALKQRQPGAGLLHHSDQGSQYTSGAYRGCLKDHGLVASMSRRGNCWDNAVAESFFATLEKELLLGWMPENRDVARRAIFDFIEVFYNRERLHSTIGYVSPLAYEAAATQEPPA
jgi:putative transposase